MEKVSISVKCELNTIYVCFSSKFPSPFWQQDRFILVVAVVIEHRNEEQVNWHLDTTKGFLSDDAQTDTVHYNPLYLNIDRSALTNDGILKYVYIIFCTSQPIFLRLPLRMCTISQNQVVKAGSVFYTLGLSDAQKLHSSDYVPDTARLACVMADQNGNIHWDTFGLSDYMRPSRKS